MIASKDSFLLQILPECVFNVQKAAKIVQINQLVYNVIQITIKMVK